MNVTELPKISIITPSYNQAPFLEATIQSVLSQRYPNLEFIIIDGGSSDNSVEIIERYSDQIDYWVSERDMGTFDANNKGLKRVTGDYWCVVNSDDLLLPGALRTVANYIMQHPQEKWICGHVDYIDQWGKLIKHGPVEVPEKIGGYRFMNGCWISHPTVFLHKSLISEIGEFGKWNYLDLDYWLRTEKAGYSPVVIDAPLAALRFHDDCKSMNYLKMWEEIYRLLNDFATREKLTENPAVKESLLEKRRILLRLSIVAELVDQPLKKNIRPFVKAALSDPGVLTSRWYWQLLKRRWMGMDANDPFAKSLGVREGNTNWSDISTTS